jgi:hypothetical protein
MMMEIPDFLNKMSKQLNSQNNRMTADPLFEVRYKSYLITEQGYSESHFEILNDDGDCLYHSDRSDDFSELALYAIENNYDWCKEWIEDSCSDECFLDDGEVNQEVFIDVFLSDFAHDGSIDLPDGLRVIYLQEIEVTVNSHFTEDGANEFIARKQHDYPKLYTYAISLCYCWDMIELRSWIKGLTNIKE